MKNDELEGDWEQFGAPMVGLDEMLAHGGDIMPFTQVPVPAELQERWQRLQVCLKLLRSAFREGKR